jgi:hypothetical protein
MYTWLSSVLGCCGPEVCDSKEPLLLAGMFDSWLGESIVNSERRLSNSGSIDCGGCVAAEKMSLSE